MESLNLQLCSRQDTTACGNGSERTKVGIKVCRVDSGGHPPESPTDPDVRISRIRLLKLRIRCTTACRVNHNRRRQRVAREQTVKSLPVHPCAL